MEVFKLPIVVIIAYISSIRTLKTKANKMFNNAYDVPYHFRNWVGRSTPKKIFLHAIKISKLKMPRMCTSMRGKGTGTPPPPNTPSTSLRFNTIIS